MAVITISRQMGSLGFEIAETVAAQLGYQLVWRELINQAAQRAKAPEVALATIDELGLLGIRPSNRARAAYHEAVAQVMSELAREGNVVIVGRAGQVILRDYPGVFHVRIVAPRELRCRRITQSLHITPEAAAAQVDASDHNRKNYCRRYYRIDWDDPTQYDLVINTNRLSIDEAVALIRQAIQLCVPPS